MTDAPGRHLNGITSAKLPGHIAATGDHSTWQGNDTDGHDRGDRYSHQPTNPQPSTGRNRHP